MKIREVMTSPAHTCRPQDSLEHAASLLWDHDCGVLPVVEADGRVAAAITDRDICMGAFVSGKRLAELRVAGSMSSSAVTCREDEDVAVVANRMADHQLRRLPVVDRDGRPQGIVSVNDLVAAGDRDTPAGRAGWKVLVAASRHRSAVPVAAAKAAPVAAANGTPASAAGPAATPKRAMAATTG